jgi:hypothetical protein
MAEFARHATRRGFRPAPRSFSGHRGGLCQAYLSLPPGGPFSPHRKKKVAMSLPSTAVAPYWRVLLAFTAPAAAQQADGALGIAPNGKVFAAWCSRRQGVGNYRIFGPLFDGLGRFTRNLPGSLSGRTVFLRAMDETGAKSQVVSEAILSTRKRTQLRLGSLHSSPSRSFKKCNPSSTSGTCC